MTLTPRVAVSCIVVLTSLCLASGSALAQNARVGGFVQDQQRRSVQGANVSFTNEATGVVRTTASDKSGAYTLVGMSPASYRIDVTHAGFTPWRKGGVVLEIQQDARLDISLDVAGVSESVTVGGGASPLGTHDGSLGLVIDRKLVGSTPLPGRTFQALIELAPGVVYAPSAAGTFSINGQRRDSNYLTIDGVSANFNISGALATQASVGTGESPTTGVTGGYNGLVSIDAIQEVRVQTSSFAPEYGRTPGGQVSVVTRSGSNALHGSFSGTYRPDALQANDWYTNYFGLSAPEFGQQIYAGTLGGPVLENKMFYFGAYERIRLRNPAAFVTEVPSLALREAPSGGVSTLLAGWPLPTGPDLDDLRALRAVSDVRPTHEDNPALRIDAQPSGRFTVFGRFARSRSKVSNQATVLKATERAGDTLTVGGTWLPTSALVGEIRFNYSAASSALTISQSTAGGAVPPPNTAWPTFVDLSRDVVGYYLPSGLPLEAGVFGEGRQRQLNAVGALSYARGSHQMKLGVDVRTLSPESVPPGLAVSSVFFSKADVVDDRASVVVYAQYYRARATFRNVSLFVQDTWRYGRRLSATYGLRWDVNPAPRFSGLQPFRTVHAEDVSRLDLVESSSSLWSTRYNNIAPRFGLSYALTDDARTTVSGGGGVFYDLGTQSSGSLLGANLFPFQRNYIASSVALPLPPPPSGVLDPVRLGDTPYGGTIYLADSDMSAPRTVQWNVKVERETGAGQLFSIAYSGNRGARLLTTQQYLKPNERFSGTVNVLRSNARSTYHALLAQYRRRALRRIHMTASYTLSSARDNVSTSAASAPDRPLSEEWGAAEFDVRHNFVAAVSIDGPSAGRGWRAAINGWGLDLFMRARSAFPLSISTGRDGLGIGLGDAERPNLVAGQSVWLEDASVPSGQRLNRAAFALPLAGAQGTLARNSVRGLAAKQVDLSLRRSLAIARVDLQIRLDAYNVFNWPQHGLFVTSLSSPRFGLSQASLNSGGGQAPSAQYSQGGPRACDLQLRVSF